MPCWPNIRPNPRAAYVGTNAFAHKGGPHVDTGESLQRTLEGALRLEELQLPGKRRATAQEFAGQLDLNGRRLACRAYSTRSAWR